MPGHYIAWCNVENLFELSSSQQRPLTAWASDNREVG